MKHEVAHIQQWHTLDVLFIEVINILFWCSPIIYFYRIALKNTHEYLADALVLKDAKRKEYGHLLLKQSMSSMQIALANHFIQSQLKNRILMMTRHQSRKRNLMKYLPLLPILILTVLIFSKRDGFAQQEAERTSLSSNELDDLIVTTYDVATEQQPTFIHPIKDQSQITNVVKYGMRMHPMFKEERLHTGVDYAVPTNTAVVATADGVLKIAVEQNTGFGNHILLEHSDGYSTFYSHLSELKVRKGNQVVKQGELIALSGNTGLSTGPHLHYEIRKDGKAFNFEGDKSQSTTEVIEDSDSVLYYEESDTIGKIFRVVQQMPRFPSDECEAKTIENDKRACSQNAMLQYIYSNLKYPAAAREAGIEGMSVVQFVVEKDGTVSDIVIAKNIGGGCGEETARVVEQMNKDGIRWIPGQQDGEIVRVKYTLPVKYKLQGDEQVIEEKSVGDEVQKEVDQMPLFPSDKCEEAETDEIKKRCSELALTQYLFKNLKYPRAARKAQLEGMCVAEFVVEKDGTLSAIKMLRTIGSGCDEEVLRVINKMNADGIRWKPGENDGEVVRTKFALPVKFQLSSEENIEVEDQTPAVASKKPILQLTNFKLAPNPSKGFVRLQFQGEAAPTQIRIYQADGKMLYEQQLNDFDGYYDQQIELPQQSGMTFVRIEQGDKAFTKQLVVE